MPKRFDATVQAYRALETLHGEGRVRAIGVSNFMPDHLESIAENFDVFDFELAPAELDAIDALDTGVRGGPDPAVITTETFALTIPEA